MPKVHRKKARSDRYLIGARIPDEKVKKGYRIDKSKPCQPEHLPSYMEKDEIFCLKGEIYYHYTKYRSSRTETKVYPKPSQLTGSGFLSSVYSIGEDIPDTFEDITQLESWVEETKSTLEEIRDETQDKLDNMPYQLQEAPTGEILSNRIESLDEWISDLESVDIEPEDKEMWSQNFNEDNPESTAEDVEAAYQEYVAEFIEEKVGEMQTEYQGG